MVTVASLRPSALPVVVRTQNWILSPVQDTIFIVATPLVTFGLAVLAFLTLGATQATTVVLLAHVVLTVAHHLPTFIRIYGDMDLFRRFKWSFIFGPLIPFGFALGVLSYLNFNDYPLENFFYLLIILALWDPWHFLMQHYGFMRIYDRPNAAPRPLAARMDLALCATWFAYIMLASGGWLPDVLIDLQTRSDVPLIFAVPMGVLSLLKDVALFGALSVSVAYGVYLGWCWRRGYFVSAPKLLLCAVTFGVMAVTYTPNPWILGLAPGWTFKVGFAVLGIAHVTQYLAIVWRYNRSLAGRADRARSGVFRALHLRGGLGVGLLYVLVCVGYGKLLTTVHDNRWLMSVLLATGFTSTLMHYYFDGFIWKVRHQQNQEALAMADGTAGSAEAVQVVTSWWASVRTVTAGRIFIRQSLYFGLPMVALTVGAWARWHQPVTDYVVYLQKVDRLNQMGRKEETLVAARRAVAAMEEQLPLAQKRAELQPSGANEAALAFLLYRHSQYREFVIPSLQGQREESKPIARHLEQVEAAIAAMERALSRGEPLGHPGRESLSPEEAQASLATWRGVAARCRASLALRG